MRMPTSKVWRAFRELDPFPDDQCRNFVRAARGGIIRTFFGIALSWAAGLATVAAGAGLGVGLASSYITPEGRVLGTGEIIIGCTTLLFLFVAGVVGLFMRDWLLRRRLRRVLNERGVCPACRYSLLGLPVPEGLKVACPECGHVIQVDPALGELSLDEAGRARFAAGNRALPRPPFWTPRRKLWRKRILISLAVLVFGVLPAIAGTWEVWIRYQSRVARRERPGPEAILAIPTSKGAARPAEGAANATDALKQAAEALQQRYETLGTRAPDFSLIYLPMWQDSPTDEDRRSYQEERQQALADLIALRREGFLDRFDAIADLPAFPAALKFADDGTLDLGFDQFGHSRRITRIAVARMELAWLDGDALEYRRALESALAAARVTGHQPFLIASLVSLSIDALVIDAVTDHLAMTDRFSHVWLDGIAAAFDRQLVRPDISFPWESERTFMLDTLAWTFSDPDRIRFGRFTPKLREDMGLEDDLIGAILESGWPNERLGSYAKNRDAANKLFEHYRVRWETPRHARPAWSEPDVPEDLLLLNTLQPAFMKFLNAQDNHGLTRSAVPVMIAIGRFRAANGDYPDSLDRLVPAYIREVPIVIYSGKPLLYKRTDPGAEPGGRPYVLYSVGPDGEDNRGTERPAANGKPRYWAPSERISGEDFVINKPAKR